MAYGFNVSHAETATTFSRLVELLLEKGELEEVEQLYVDFVEKDKKLDSIVSSSIFQYSHRASHFRWFTVHVLFR